MERSVSRVPLTAARVREVLDYSPDTGTFVWKIFMNSRAPKGRQAGRIGTPGYYIIRLDGRDYLAHRLAWFYVYGSWPPEEIDHINGIPIDNRITNLRCATRGQNAANARRAKNNTSGFKGAYWQHGRWQAIISVNKQRMSLGFFDSAEEAHAAYCSAAYKYFGEFARTA